MQAPIDALGVAVDDAGICRIRFGGAPPDRAVSPPDEVLERATDELTRYFAGEAVTFTVPLSVPGGSPFERAVWRQLYVIPYAEMRTYGQIAAAVGEPDAARAVGTACNRNPIPVIIPCHRVVGADGKLVGFGGGLWRKKVLLELEARVRIEREFGLG
ncbi:methylated-DNA--[protein]-cysteine S-methyltransferase [Dactylosporangium sp. CA-092794]|uniref:methylated-DNA--[protein]-cysteine S-methyltransferase n=1 Tax=Dactylosporangium sp. CA-092794 TaxID=3239929 RepID=UPI003D8A1438